MFRKALTVYLQNVLIKIGELLKDPPICVATML